MKKKFMKSTARQTYENEPIGDSEQKIGRQNDTEVNEKKIKQRCHNEGEERRQTERDCSFACT